MLPSSTFPMHLSRARVEREQDMVIMKLRGVLVDILLDIAPETCKKCITENKKGDKQLIVQCQNAIYGAMMSSLLHHKKFTGSTVEHGFVINPCDPCIANKTVDGKQMTILCHVDNCKLSHVDPKANNEMIEWL